LNITRKKYLKKMRIKKKQILEAAAQVDTSNTSKNSGIPNQGDMDKAKKNIQDLEKEIEDGPLMAFMKVSENNMPGDVDDFTSDAIDAMADRDEQNRRDYDEWLQSPEGQEYIKSLDSLNESISGRKIIKTIKVKDLK
jgi:hypothetical protein